jgi:hypothetical protein
MAFSHLNHLADEESVTLERPIGVEVPFTGGEEKPESSYANIRVLVAEDNKINKV